MPCPPSSIGYSHKKASGKIAGAQNERRRAGPGAVACGCNMVENVVIMGAAGRDFHNFNVYFKDNPRYNVVAFTAALWVS